MKYSVVIPAAGQGKRMNVGKNKQFLLLEDRPVIIHTLMVFEEDPHCREIIVVANEMEKEEMQSLFSDWNLRKVQHVVCGGAERQDSVLAGIRCLQEEEMILIHDGARPFIEQHDIHRLVKETTQCGAAVLAVPMKDTVKRVVNGKVVETADRSQLWAVQTPQAFFAETVRQAYENAEYKGIRGTDDASLVELTDQGEVYIVEGSYDNIKLTTPEDIIVAEAILKKRRREGGQ